MTLTTEARTIGLIYEAALDRECWAEVMATIGEEAKAVSGLYAVVSGDLETCPCTVGHRVPDEALTLFTGYLDNPWTKAGATLPSGYVSRISDCVPTSEVMCSDYYQELLRPFECLYSIGCVVQCPPFGFVGFTIYRGESSSDFDDDEVRAVARYGRHIERASQAGLRFLELQQHRAAAMESLDRLEELVILIEEEGRVAFANRTAERLLQLHDGLTLRRGELRAATAQETAALSRAIGAAVETARGRGDSSGGVVSISRPSGRPPLVATVTPLFTERLAVGGARAMAAVFVTDPELRRETDEQHLARLFGLTPAETRLAAALGTGEGLARAADRLGVARNTAKAQARGLYAKLGAKRQSDVVRIVASAQGSKKLPRARE